MSNNILNIALLEGFCSGSHKSWAQDFQSNTAHNIKIFSLPGRFWKWRMHGGAITLASQFTASKFQSDVIIATDMIDLSLFLSLTRQKTSGCKVCIYFHENQLSYPWSPTDPDVLLKRDNHYAFINYSSALVADHVLFNSHYHKQSFIDALPAFLRQFPDHKNLETKELIEEKSSVIPLGFDFSNFQNKRVVTNSVKTILWNHRWEYDKYPEVFFQSLYDLKDKSIPFQVIVIGEHGKTYPSIFDEAREILQEHTIHWGYVEGKEAYRALLQKSDILLVTSIQDFFGISIIEAIAAGVTPLLPNRLAYPSHIEDHLHQVFLYENQKDMTQKLQDLLQRDPLPKASLAFLSKYEWKAVLELWDNILVL